ncbi:MAG TPA: class I SAM-dependent methyltransferase [Thermoanaerobaculia bacterium]
MADPDPRWKRLLKTVVPAPARRRLRRWQAELPTRLRDAPGDLLDSLPLPGRVPFPPARLRARVGWTRSRREYERAGGDAARSVLDAFGAHGNSPGGRWLDFGCGSGRLARHFLASPSRPRLVGADVDLEALLWCARHLPGAFVGIPAHGTLPFRDAAFDVVVASSVFTHLDRGPARGWLAEIRRVLVPGGLLLASTHSERLAYLRPDLTAEDRRALEQEGFAFRKGSGPFNDACAFHTREFLARDWGGFFDLAEHRPHGLAGFQDLTVWRRAEAGAIPRESRSTASRS